MSRLAARSFTLHRWLGWIVGLQVLLWVVGGVLFALLPHDAWVKSHDAVHPPRVELPAGWGDAVAPALRQAGPVTALSAVATPRGPALRLLREGQSTPTMLPADGSAWVPPDAEAVRRFAAAMHREGAAVVDVARIDAAPRRLGIVDETGGRRDLWRVRFDDGLGTRVYLDGETGVFVAARNEAWVWYDLFWRLHIMDYTGGEDINGWLLRAAALLAFGLVAAGAVLAWLAARRRWRRRHRA